VAKPFQYRFEWDPDKAKQNVRKHGISFDRATSVLLDPEALSKFDEEHSQDEDRWVTLGLDGTGAILVVCHTYHEIEVGSATIRIISSRKATKNEAKQYRRT
jgi:uncharacterized DUF497 family protein